MSSRQQTLTIIVAALALVAFSGVPVANAEDESRPGGCPEGPPCPHTGKFVEECKKLARDKSISDEKVEKFVERCREKMAKGVEVDKKKM